MTPTSILVPPRSTPIASTVSGRRAGLPGEHAAVLPAHASGRPAGAATGAPRLQGVPIAPRAPESPAVSRSRKAARSGPGQGAEPGRARGEGAADTCGPLVQQVVGCLFVPDFKATPESWAAAVILDKAVRTMNPALLAWWSATMRVDRAKRLLSEMVRGDLAGVHAVGSRAAQYCERCKPHAGYVQRSRATRWPVARSGFR